MNNSQLINQTSGAVEYYTPPKIVEAAREVLGVIDLDPASSRTANEVVKAVVYFSKETDGLSQAWFGNVWMNHPFSKKANPLWINKLILERGHYRQALCITYACTSEKWFRPLLEFPQCFLYPRTNYFLPDGTAYKGVTKGSVVTYIGNGNCTEVFKEIFEIKYGFGKVKI